MAEPPPTSARGPSSVEFAPEQHEHADKKRSGHGAGMFGRMKAKVGLSDGGVDMVHAAALKPEAACECSGWLFKQGKQVMTKDWKRRYFVVVAGVVGYYDEKEAAVNCEIKKCKFAGIVRSAERWPPQYNKKPRDIPDKVSSAAAARDPGPVSLSARGGSWPAQLRGGTARRAAARTRLAPARRERLGAETHAPLPPHARARRSGRSTAARASSSRRTTTRSRATPTAARSASGGCRRCAARSRWARGGSRSARSTARRPRCRRRCRRSRSSTSS